MTDDDLIFPVGAPIHVDAALEHQHERPALAGRPERRTLFILPHVAVAFQDLDLVVVELGIEFVHAIFSARGPRRDLFIPLLHGN